MRPTVIAILAVLASAGCSGSSEPGHRDRDPVDVERTIPAPEPLLPEMAGRLAPARLVAPPGPGTSGSHLADTEACVACHASIGEQWESSAHAFSSFSNPIYRVTVDKLRAEIGKRESRFCGGCHDAAMLVDGVLDGVLAPEDARAHAGISCRMCHGATEARPDGNGSLALRPTALPLPDTSSEASVEAHKQAASVRRFGADLCVSCHRGFLDDSTGNPFHVGGLDDVVSWRSSSYAGNDLTRVDNGVKEADCIGCHMAPEHVGSGEPAADAGGMVASHRFIGGHTWLASMRDDDAQLERVRKLLEGAVSVDIAAARSGGELTLGADGAALKPGGELILTVVLRNLLVGHKFPGGVIDLQDVWLEVEARDEKGRLIAGAGLDHRNRIGDPSAHVLRSLVVGEDGKLLLTHPTHQFRTAVIDHTLGPRQSGAIEYRLPIPEAHTGAIDVRARLLHRSRNLELQRVACEGSRARRVKAFAAGSKRHRGHALDPCEPQPVTEIGSDQARLGHGAPPVPDARPRWKRMYELGMALARGIQEELDRARPPLEAALAELADEPTGSWKRAAVLAELGRTAGTQGRTEVALAFLARAEADAPGHPALASLRAAALTRVWRWEESLAPLRHATKKAPGNTRGWVDLSIALGSAGQDAEALMAAKKGLALTPRESSLLRVQALSLKGLGVPFDDALAAFDRYRQPDVASELRIRCASGSDECARERQPIHVHDMRPPR